MLLCMICCERYKKTCVIFKPLFRGMPSYVGESHGHFAFFSSFTFKLRTLFFCCCFYERIFLPKIVTFLANMLFMSL